MVRKLAIDWDEIELRLVVAQCSGGSVKVTDAAVIPVENSNVVATLCSAIEQRGLEHSESLIAIGRGMAELRELQLPSVPAEELPDMVRFQAIRNFASAGESATVDYLVTSRDDSGIGLIAAAVGPDKLTEIRNAGAAADLNIKRVSLRPLCAAALYLVNRDNESKSDTVLIDLLANDAEIVIAREGRVIFVRTVRMPATEATRGKALAGELRRSLVACGSTGSLERVVLWGRESVHADDVKMLAEASGSPVDVLDPFDVVGTDSKVKAGLPEHVGRLAPLVGLLVADECAPDRLIDFLNPRQRMEETTNPYRTALLVGVPVAIAVLLCFLLLSHLKGLDRQIAKLKTENENLKPGVDAALASIGRTNTVDDFLDGDVNWLDEIRRLATQMPPSDKLIVQSISGTSNARAGGGEFNVIGVVTNAGVIDDFEERLRDETHVVAGDGATELETQDGYRWEFDESITINAESIRNSRYAAMVPAPADAAAQDGSAEDAAAEDASAEDGSAEDASAEDASAEEFAPAEESPPPDESPPDESPPNEAASDSDSEIEPSEDEQPQPAELAADQSAEVQS
jgi:Tfp pilus assembly PilM family ATPase